MNIFQQRQYDALRKKRDGNTAPQKMSTSNRAAAERAQAGIQRARAGAAGATESKAQTFREFSERQRMTDAPVRWYQDEQPTARETLARIYEIGRTSPRDGEKLYREYERFTGDASTPLYAPYTKATSKAFEALGLDADKGVDEAFFTQNAGLKNSYRTSATGTTPLGPTKSSTGGQDAAYWLYQMLEDEAPTKQAEAEWDGLQQELRYWAGRSDRNYSDGEIMARVDWEKYPTLRKMDEGQQKGVPLSLNRPVAYSKDAMVGVLWAARNPNEATGDPMTDAVQGALGRGRAYQRDEQTAARLDPTSPSYAPYTVGSTMDAETQLFGTDGFDQQWLDDNYGAVMAGGDEGAIKAYGRVYEAEKQTQAAEKDAADLNAAIERRIANGEKPEDIFTEEFLDLYPELQKMQDALQKGRPLALTRAVDFELNSAYQKAQTAYNKRMGTVSGEAYAQGVSAALGAPVSTPSTAEAVNAERNQNLDTVRGTLAETGTPEEQRFLHTGGGASFAPTALQVRDSIQRGAGGVTEMQDSLYAAADKYAGEHYMGAIGVIVPYEKAVQDREKALAEIEQLQSAKGVNPADYVTVTENADGSISFKSDLESLFADEAAQQQAPQRLEELQGIVAAGDAAIQSRQSAYEAAMQTVGSVRDRYAAAGPQNGNNTLALLDYAYCYGGEYEPTVWTAQTSYQAALDAGYTREEVSAAAKEGMAANTEEIARIDYVLEQLEERGVKIDGGYIANLERLKEKLQRDVKDAEYFQLSENADFEEVAESTMAGIAEKGWKGNSAPKLAKELAGLTEEIPASLSLGSVFAHQFHLVQQSFYDVTPDERNTYFYLLSTQGEEAAQAYYDHLTDPTYGTLTTRGMENFQEFVASGAGEMPVTSTLLSVIASPLQLAGTAYAAVTTLLGNEINPYNPAFAASAFVDTTRAAVKDSINTAFGADTWQAWLANFGYDALTGAADSALNSFLMSGLGIGLKISPSSKFGKAAAKVANSMFGASSMGAQAAGNSARDTMLREGNTTQAWLMAGTTFLAETLSEGITLGNISDALGGKAAEKGFVRELLSDMLEEFLGEGGGQLIETVSDDQIMGALANRKQAELKYMDDGLSPEQAQARANTDAWLDILHSAGLGMASAGMTTTAGYAAGRLSGSSTNTGAPDGTKARAVTALAQAEISGVGMGGQTATLAGALGAMSGQEAAATAAAQSLMEGAPEAALATARQIVLASDDSDTVSALQFAAIMPESDSGKLLADMQETGVTPEKVEAMTDAAVRELGDPVMNGNYHNAVANSIEAVETMNLLMNDAHQEVERKKAEAKKARAEWTKAKSQLADVKRQVTEAETTYARANDAFQQNTSNPALAQEVTRTLDRLWDARRKVNELHKQAVEANEHYNALQGEQKKLAQSEVNKARTLAQESSFGQNYRELGYANLSDASSFAEAVQAWEGLDGAVKTNLDVPFVMGRTTPLLQSYGAPDADIAMLSSKLTAIQKKHPEMSADILAKLPEIVQNPVLITKSKTVNDRLVLFGTVYTDDGTPIVAVLSLNGEKNRVQNVDFIKMHSAYGKDTDAQAFIDASEVLYVDKNRSHEWELSTGLQLLFDASRTSDPATDQAGGQGIAPRTSSTEASTANQGASDDQSEGPTGLWAYQESESFFTGSDNSIAQTDEKMQASEALERMASGKHSEFVQSVQAAAGEYGDFIDGGVKSVSSMQAKVERKRASGQAQYAAGDMKDHVRGAIMLKNGLNDVPAVVEALKKQFPALTGEAFLERPLNMTGYRGIHLVAELGGGINGEIQLTTPEAWKIKKQTDAIYQKWRDVDLETLSQQQKTQYKEDMRKSSNLWEQYYAGFTPDVIRIASSSVIGLESIKSPHLPTNGIQEEALNSMASDMSPSLKENSLFSSKRENSKAFNDTTSIPIIPDFPGENNDGESDKASPEASFVDANPGMEQIDGEAQAAGQKDGAQLDTEAGQRDNQEGAYTPDRIEAFAKAGGVEKLAMPPQEIYRFTQGRRDLSESLLLAIPEAYGDEGLSVKERAEKYRLPERPEKASLSTYQTRIWYRWQESRIRERLDYSKPLEDVARQAFEMRNEIRTGAREAMADTVWAEYLREVEENFTWEGMLAYKKEKGLSGNELWKSIIESSMRSRPQVDGLFSLVNELKKK